MVLFVGHSRYTAFTLSSAALSSVLLPQIQTFESLLLYANFSNKLSGSLLKLSGLGKKKKKSFFTKSTEDVIKANPLVKMGIVIPPLWKKCFQTLSDAWNQGWSQIHKFIAFCILTKHFPCTVTPHNFYSLKWQQNHHGFLLSFTSSWIEDFSFL